MCKRTERLSPRSYRCAMKQFLPCQQMRIAPTWIRYRPFQANLCWAADGLHHNLKIETIIARALQYSVGHFIDCNPVTRRLLQSHFLLLFCWLVRLLETLLEWPQIQFVRPSRGMLCREAEVGSRHGVRIHPRGLQRPESLDFRKKIATGDRPVASPEAPDAPRFRQQQPRFVPGRAFGRGADASSLGALVR